MFANSSGIDEAVKSARLSQNSPVLQAAVDGAEGSGRLAHSRGSPCPGRRMTSSSNRRRRVEAVPKGARRRLERVETRWDGSPTRGLCVRAFFDRRGLQRVDTLPADTPSLRLLADRGGRSRWRVSRARSTGWRSSLGILLGRFRAVVVLFGCAMCRTRLPTDRRSARLGCGWCWSSCSGSSPHGRMAPSP